MSLSGGHYVIAMRDGVSLSGLTRQSLCLNFFYKDAALVLKAHLVQVFYMVVGFLPEFKPAEALFFERAKKMIADGIIAVLLYSIIEKHAELAAFSLNSRKQADNLILAEDKAHKISFFNYLRKIREKKLYIFHIIVDKELRSTFFIRRLYHAEFFAVSEKLDQIIAVYQKKAGVHHHGRVSMNQHAVQNAEYRPDRIYDSQLDDRSHQERNQHKSRANIANQLQNEFLVNVHAGIIADLCKRTKRFYFRMTHCTHKA